MIRVSIIRPGRNIQMAPTFFGFCYNKIKFSCNQDTEILSKICPAQNTQFNVKSHFPSLVKVSLNYFVNNFLTKQARMSLFAAYKRKLNHLPRTFWKLEIGKETAEIQASKGVVIKKSHFPSIVKVLLNYFVNNFLTEQARMSLFAAYERRLNLLSRTFWKFEICKETAEI